MRRWLGAVAALVMALAAATASAAEAGLEARVKAAYLYQFASYVEWPRAAFAAPDAPLTIAVFGAGALATELENVLKGRTVHGRPVVMKRLKPGDPLDGVHMLFVGDDASSGLAQIAQGAQPLSVLTVSESEGALARGSIINFVVTERRVRFEVALDTAEKSGLKLSSRLLAVAQQVRTGAN